MRINEVTIQGDRGRQRKLVTTNAQYDRHFQITLRTMDDSDIETHYVDNQNDDEFYALVARVQELCDGARGCSGDRSPYETILCYMIGR